MVGLTGVLQDSTPGEVDLHGLYVKEAITYSERAINDARRRGDAKVHLIVGTPPFSVIVSPSVDAERARMSTQAKVCTRRAASPSSSPPSRN